MDDLHILIRIPKKFQKLLRFSHSMFCLHLSLRQTPALLQKVRILCPGLQFPYVPAFRVRTVPAFPPQQVENTGTFREGAEAQLIRGVPMEADPAQSAAAPALSSDAVTEAIEAMIALGYSSTEARNAISQVRDQTDKPEELIRLALRAMAGF